MSTPSTQAVAQPLALRGERPGRQLARALRRRRRLRAGIAQLLAIAVAVGFAFLAPHVDIGFEVATGRAIEMPVAVGAGTVTFIGIVFSLLFLVVQFGSTTFTPRLNLFRDAPIVWRAFALWAGVVIYSFTAAPVIGRHQKTSGLVPIVAFAAVLASLIVYRQLQMAAFRSIQLAPTLAQVGRHGREVIEELYITQPSATGATLRVESARTAPAFDAATAIRWPGPPGILKLIDVPRVMRAAVRNGAKIHFTVRPGELITERGVAAQAGGQADAQLVEQVIGTLTVGEERTFEQDPELAIRVLADIALRALSPAVNDPTTAVQALDAADGLLRALASRDLEIGQIAGPDGVVRVDAGAARMGGLRLRRARRNPRAPRHLASRRAPNRSAARRPRSVRASRLAGLPGGPPRPGSCAGLTCVG